MTRLPALLLRAACPSRDLPYIVAELEMEYEDYILPARGPRAARRWLWSQTARSVGALAMMGLRRHDWEYSLFAIVLAAAAPAVLMESWWIFLLSTVPLKADIVRGSDFVLMSLALTATLGCLAGVLCTVCGLLLAIPAAWVVALLGQAAVRSITPAWFAAATLFALALALSAGACVRHIFDKPQGGTFA